MDNPSQGTALHLSWTRVLHNFFVLNLESEFPNCHMVAWWLSHFCSQAPAQMHNSSLPFCRNLKTSRAYSRATCRKHNEHQWTTTSRRKLGLGVLSLVGQLLGLLVVSRWQLRHLKGDWADTWLRWLTGATFGNLWLLADLDIAIFALQPSWPPMQITALCKEKEGFRSSSQALIFRKASRTCLLPSPSPFHGFCLAPCNRQHVWDQKHHSHMRRVQDRLWCYDYVPIGNSTSTCKEKPVAWPLTLSSRSGDDSIAEDLHLTSLGCYRAKFSWFAQKNNMFWCQPTEILT